MVPEHQHLGALRFPSDFGELEVDLFFSLSESEFEFVRLRRGDLNRVGEPLHRDRCVGHCLQVVFAGCEVPLRRQHGRANFARRNSVDPNSLLGVVEGQRSGELVHGTFRDAIRSRTS